MLYYLFWMFMGFILHIYIIFGTNLLTGGPTRISVFCLFHYFEEKEYQMESKWNETFGNVIFSPNVTQGTWSGRQATSEAVTRVPNVPCKGGCAPHPRGPLERSPTYFFLLYKPTYPKNLQGATEEIFPLP